MKPQLVCCIGPPPQPRIPLTLTIAQGGQTPELNQDIRFDDDYLRFYESYSGQRKLPQPVGGSTLYSELGHLHQQQQQQQQQHHHQQQQQQQGFQAAAAAAAAAAAHYGAHLGASQTPPPSQAAAAAALASLMGGGMTPGGASCVLWVEGVDEFLASTAVDEVRWEGHVRLHPHSVITNTTGLEVIQEADGGLTPGMLQALQQLGE